MGDIKKIIVEIDEMIKEADKNCEMCSKVEYDNGFYSGKADALSEIKDLLLQEMGDCKNAVSKCKKCKQYHYNGSDSIRKNIEKRYKELFPGDIACDDICNDCMKDEIHKKSIQVISAGNTLYLKYLGTDGFDKCVYKDQFNNVWKDISLQFNPNKSNLCTSSNNDVDGEPDDYMSETKYKDCKIEEIKGVK